MTNAGNRVGARWAAARVEEGGVGRRLAGASSSPVLPPVSFLHPNSPASATIRLRRRSFRDVAQRRQKGGVESHPAGRRRCDARRASAMALGAWAPRWAAARRSPPDGVGPAPPRRSPQRRRRQLAAAPPSPTPSTTPPSAECGPAPPAWPPARCAQRAAGTRPKRRRPIGASRVSGDGMRWMPSRRVGVERREARPSALERLPTPRPPSTQAPPPSSARRRPWRPPRIAAALPFRATCAWAPTPPNPSSSATAPASPTRSSSWRTSWKNRCRGWWWRGRRTRGTACFAWPRRTAPPSGARALWAAARRPPTCGPSWRARWCRLWTGTAWGAGGDGGNGR